MRLLENKIDLYEFRGDGQRICPIQPIVRCQKKRNMGRSNEEVNRPVEKLDRLDDAGTLPEDDSNAVDELKGINPYEISQLIY